MVSERSGLSQETVRKLGEYSSNSLLYTLAINYASAYNLSSKGGMVIPDQVFAFQTELIRELAERESCVIVGRCADYLLHDRADCLHIYLFGDMEERKKRAKHYAFYTDQTWGMAKNYNLCLDSSKLGIDCCVEMICQCISS